MSPVILPEIQGHLTVRALKGEVADGFALSRADCFPVVEVAIVHDGADSGIGETEAYVALLASRAASAICPASILNTATAAASIAACSCIDAAAAAASSPGARPRILTGAPRPSDCPLNPIRKELPCPLRHGCPGCLSCVPTSGRRPVTAPTRTSTPW